MQGFARRGRHNGLPRPEVIAQGSLKDLPVHIGKHGLPGAGPSHHEDVAPVLRDLSKGRLGGILENNLFNGIFRQRNLGGILKEAEPIRKGEGILKQLLYPGIILFPVIATHPCIP